MRIIPHPPPLSLSLLKQTATFSHTTPSILPAPSVRRYDFVREVIELQRAAKADGSAEASAAADDAIDSAAEKGGFDLSFLDDQMREAEWEADFVPASRITAADEANDRTSIERKLSKSLYLALPGAGAGAEGSSAAALLPSTAYDSASDGDSLRATAERAVATACGDDVEVFFGSNAPLGHWVRPFAAEEQQASGVYGEKTFLFNARYISGAESLKEGDALWLTREELAEELASAASTTDDFPQFLEHHILGGCVNDIEGVDEPRV